MKLFDKFSDKTCKQGAELTISVLFASHGITMSSELDNKVHELVEKNARFFVYIGGLGDNAVEFTAPSSQLAKIVSYRAAHGCVLYVNRGKVLDVTGENISRIYNLIMPKPTNNGYGMDKKYHERERFEMFREGMPQRRAKKPALHGYERTYRANRSLELL